MDGRDRLSFLGARCTGTVRLRTLTLDPDEAIGYQAADWADTLVVVERGDLEIECLSGALARFPQGAILVFTGLELRRLRNPGRGPLVLSAVTRIRAAG